jgi:gamma-glutamyltranspeptidase/glutathione hydrolase
MTREDLAAYQPETREARCETYRGYRLCGFPPPAGSMVAVTILKLLEPFDLAAMKPNGAEFLHLYAQANMLAYADRDSYYADPSFADVPLDALLASERLQAGSDAIVSGPLRAAGADGAGERTLQPVSVERARHPVCAMGARFRDGTSEAPSTSHVSIMDAEGNALAMTSSIEANFGSMTMAGGFVLNNQLTDFEFVPCADHRLKANAAQPGKRPRSSMSPVVVLEDGAPVLAGGSPGGPAIISYVAQTLIAVLDWNMDPQDAVGLPHVVGRKGTTFVEDHPDLDPTIPDQLEALGHEVVLGPQTSGLSVVYRSGTGLAGGADPRRDGVAAGD